MSPLMKVIAIASLLCFFTLVAICEEGAGSCVDVHDTASLVQIKQFVKRRERGPNKKETTTLDGTEAFTEALGRHDEEDGGAAEVHDEEDSKAAAQHDKEDSKAANIYNLQANRKAQGHFERVAAGAMAVMNNSNRVGTKQVDTSLLQPWSFGGEDPCTELIANAETNKSGLKTNKCTCRDTGLVLGPSYAACGNNTLEYNFAPDPGVTAACTCMERTKVLLNTNAELQLLKTNAPSSPKDAKPEQQGFNSFDDFYEAAVEAQWALLEKLKPIAKTCGMQVAACPPKSCPPNGVKSKQGSIEKYKTEYKGEWQKMSDICRASLVTAGACDIGAVAQTWKELAKDITFLKNKWANPPADQNGYADLNSLVSIPIKGRPVICEVQIHMAAMQDVKNLEGYEGGHYWFEEERGYARVEKKKNLADINKYIGKKLTKKRQEQIYAGVWKRCFGSEVQWSIPQK